jgi:hypothetical protein
MTPLERLFRLEIEYRRILRSDAPGTPEAFAPHTSYALQNGYDALIRGVGNVTTTQLKRMACELLTLGDPQDVRAAEESLIRLLWLWPYED